MFSDRKEFLTNAYKKILLEVQPSALYGKYLHVFDRTLYYRNTALEIDPGGKLVLAGSGKAAVGMARAMLPYLSRNADDTLLISPFKDSQAPFRVIPGDHPVPGKNSLRAANKMLAMIRSLNQEDTLLYFLSGGSSALMELPVQGLEIDDICKTTQTCLARGLNIYEINALRGALSLVKAGQLAPSCKARCYVFVLSDVMGNDLSVIGSGPFYPPNTSHAKIAEIINKYKLDTFLSSRVIKVLTSYEHMLHEPHIPHYLIGSNMDLMQAAETVCFDHGIKPVSFPESLFGEAQQAGKMIADMLKLYTGDKPVCMIFGGETTVTLNEHPGKGGRAQELALSVLQELRDTPGITLLSAGSDGIDGVGGAAGAVVSSDTYKKALKLGLSVQEHLKNHDSYHFHQQCDSLIETGYSGTNVGDLVMGLIN